VSRSLATTFKALSEETRLQILMLLFAREELCVCDFVETLQMTQSKVSRHLRYLYNAGLVEDRRAGLWIHYRISPDLSREQRIILETLRNCIDENYKQELLDRLEEWLKRKAAGGTPMPDAGQRCERKT